MKLTVMGHIGHQWRTLGVLTPESRPGSMSSIDPDGRQVYLFGWINGEAGVWRSDVGVDVEDHDLRLISTSKLSLVANPRYGPVEMVWNRPGEVPIPLRFTLT